MKGSTKYKGREFEIKFAMFLTEWKTEVNKSIK